MVNVRRPTASAVGEEAVATATRLIPPRASLSSLRRRAAECEACSLCKNATQTVFGEGSPRAGTMLVGETPGDQEDLQGRPFVGPSGHLLDRCLAEAGIDRKRTYVTNVVKHFKFTQLGKRRLHKKPSAGEIQACRPWLDAEIAIVRPKVLVCLGATAARAILGEDFRVSQSREHFIESALAPHVITTVHPSSLLRARDEDRRRAVAHFIDDLRKVAALGR